MLEQWIIEQFLSSNAQDFIEELYKQESAKVFQIPEQ